MKLLDDGMDIDEEDNVSDYNRMLNNLRQGVRNSK